MKNAAITAGLQFHSTYLFPLIKILTEEQTRNNKQHLLIILEDLQSYFKSISKVSIANLHSFIYKSRHLRISLITLFHSMNFQTKTDSFEKLFISQATAVVLFKSMVNRQTIKSFVQRFFDKIEMNHFFYAMWLSDQVFRGTDKRPYVIIFLGKQLIKKIY